jgi:hypothetical protein
LFAAGEAAQGWLDEQGSGFVKKTQKTPPRELALAERRLAEWRDRGRHTGKH